MIGLVMEKQLKKISEETFKNRLQTITDGLKEKSLIHQLWSAIEIIKWLISITVLVLLRDNPGFQIQSLLTVTLIY